MDKCLVYVIKHLSNDKIVYVGETLARIGIESRLLMHRSERSRNEAKYLYLKKHWEDLCIVAVSEHPNKHEAQLQEAKLIAEARQANPGLLNVLNSSHRHGVSGFRHSEKTKQHLSSLNKQRHSKNPVSSETRAKSSESLRKRNESQSQRLKHSIAQKKRFLENPVTVETRDKQKAYWSLQKSKEAQSLRRKAYFEKEGSREAASTSQLNRFTQVKEVEKISAAKASSPFYSTGQPRIRCLCLQPNLVFRVEIGVSNGKSVTKSVGKNIFLAIKELHAMQAELGRPLSLIPDIYLGGV